MQIGWWWSSLPPLLLTSTSNLLSDYDLVMWATATPSRYTSTSEGGVCSIQHIEGAHGVSGHKQLRDFADTDARDRWRSSWARFPKLAAALVRAVDATAPPAADLVYEDELEAFACAWHDAGLPVYLVTIVRQMHSRLGHLTGSISWFEAGATAASLQGWCRCRGAPSKGSCPYNDLVCCPFSHAPTTVWHTACHTGCSAHSFMCPPLRGTHHLTLHCSLMQGLTSVPYHKPRTALATLAPMGESRVHRGGPTSPVHRATRLSRP